MYFYLCHYSRDVTSFSLQEKFFATTAAQHPPVLCVALKQCHLARMGEILRSSNLRLFKRVMESHKQKVKQKAVNCECGRGSLHSYLLVPRKLNVCQAAVKGCVPDEEAIQLVTQEGDTLKGAQTRSKLIRIVKTAAEVRWSQGGAAAADWQKFLAQPALREAADVTQRRAVLISLHLLPTPVYCTSNTFTYPGMKWK